MRDNIFSFDAACCCGNKELVELCLRERFFRLLRFLLPVRCEDEGVTPPRRIAKSRAAGVRLDKCGVLLLRWRFDDDEPRAKMLELPCAADLFLFRPMDTDKGLWLTLLPKYSFPVAVAPFVIRKSLPIGVIT